MKYAIIRNVKTLSRGTKQSAGVDFFIPNDIEPITIQPGKSINIPSGVKVAVAPNHVGIFFNKSSIGVLGLIAGAAVIDSDYRGEIMINLHNVSSKSIEVRPGQKIIQMLIVKVSLGPPEQITLAAFDQISKTERGLGGFGSTGGF